MEIPPGTPIIIDIGSAYTKVGLAGESKPREVFPTITGTEKYQTVMVDIGSREIYVGHDAMKMRGVLKVKYPIQRGAITDWDSFYAILNYIFYTVLRIDNISNYPVLYIEDLFLPREIKEYIAKIMFETHRVGSLLMVPAPLLALISVGITTGIVVESGDGTTWVVPIMNGKIIHQAVQKLYLGGADVNHSLKTLLMKEGISITSSILDEIVKDMKEKYCYFVLDPKNPPKTSEKYSFTMPDGSNIDVPHYVFFEAPEVLFRPSIIGSNAINIPQAIIECLKNVDNIYWGDLLSHIVLSGGNLTYNGFEERFKLELNQLIPQLGPIPKSQPKKTDEIQEGKLISLDATDKKEDTCSQCGNVVDLTDGKQNCSFCGAAMTLPTIPLDLGKVNKSEKQKIYPKQCPFCGKDIKDEASIFCPYCGKSIEIEVVSNLKKQALQQPPTNEFAEYHEPSAVAYFFIPDNLQLAPFSGGAILGSLPSFQRLFITYEQFKTNPESIYRDISEIF